MMDVLGVRCRFDSSSLLSTWRVDVEKRGNKILIALTTEYFVGYYREARPLGALSLRNGSSRLVSVGSSTLVVAVE